jgi:hypothetical protein
MSGQTDIRIGEHDHQSPGSIATRGVKLELAYGEIPPE